MIIHILGKNIVFYCFCLFGFLFFVLVLFSSFFICQYYGLVRLGWFETDIFGNTPSNWFHTYIIYYTLFFHDLLITSIYLVCCSCLHTDGVEIQWSERGYGLVLVTVMLTNQVMEIWQPSYIRSDNSYIWRDEEFTILKIHRIPDFTTDYYQLKLLRCNILQNEFPRIHHIVKTEFAFRNLLFFCEKTTTNLM